MRIQLEIAGPDSGAATRELGVLLEACFGTAADQDGPDRTGRIVFTLDVPSTRFVLISPAEKNQMLRCLDRLLREVRTIPKPHNVSLRAGLEWVDLAATEAEEIVSTLISAARRGDKPRIEPGSKSVDWSRSFGWTTGWDPVLEPDLLGGPPEQDVSRPDDALAPPGEPLPAAEPPQQLRHLALDVAEISPDGPFRDIPLEQGLWPERFYRLTFDLRLEVDSRRHGTGGEVRKTAGETVELQVAIVNRTPALVRFEQQVTRLVWDAEDRIAPAVFVLQTLQATGRAAFDVFLHRDCDLLLAAKVEAEISNVDEACSKPDPINWRDVTDASTDRRSVPFRRFLQASRGQRALCLAVQRGEGADGYLLTILFRGAELPLRVSASRAELEYHLVRVRSVLDRLRRDGVVLDGGFDPQGTYTGAYDPGTPCHRSDGTRLPAELLARRLGDFLRELALAGVAIRSALFPHEAHRIGLEAIQRHAQAGSVIQVWLDQAARDFVIPWHWIYDAPLDPSWRADRVDPTQFWGYRLVIEQVTDCTDRALPAADPDVGTEAGLRIRVGTYDFPETGVHVDFLRSLAARSRSPVDLEIWSEDRHWEDYLPRCDADLLYFFAHGHTALPVASPATMGLSRVVEELRADLAAQAEDGVSREALQARQRLQAALTELEARGMWQEHHIRLSAGHLKMEDLRRVAFTGRKTGRTPLVLLNMCESAQVFPSLTDGLVHVFLRAGALGVVGTEMPMVPRFADLFGRLLLERLAAGEPIGQAMLALRRAFLDRRNPLGFAYTQFGNAFARLVPPLVQPSIE